MLIMEKGMLKDYAGLLLGTIALIISIKSLCDQKLVVVDVRRAIEVTAVMLSKTSLAPGEQARVMRKFSQKLPNSIEEYANAHKVTVINAPVFVSKNTFDITSRIVKTTLSEVRYEK